MTSITIDTALREKLLAAGEYVELRDETGRLIAHALVYPVEGDVILRDESGTVVAHVTPSEPPGGLRRLIRRFQRAVLGPSQSREPSYSRFTDRSRKVMQLANQEAQRFNHEYIGTEHVLLGLVAEGNGVAANILKNLDIDLRKIRLELEKIVQHGPGGEQIVMGRRPHTPRAKKVIEYSVEEARNLNHNYIGTEHLLLGLMREEGGVAAQVLMNLGLTLEGVRKEVLNLLGHPPHG